MKKLVIAFSMLLFFSNSVSFSAISQKNKSGIQLRKWVTVPIDGIPHTLKMFLSADEVCKSVQRTNARSQCYRVFDILPVESEPLGDNEIEYISIRGTLARATQETFCAAQEAGEKTGQSYLIPCYAMWGRLKKQEKRPPSFCRKIETFYGRKGEQCYAQDFHYRPSARLEHSLSNKDVRNEGAPLVSTCDAPLKFHNYFPVLLIVRCYRERHLAGCDVCAPL